MDSAQEIALNALNAMAYGANTSHRLLLCMASRSKPMISCLATFDRVCSLARLRVFVRVSAWTSASLVIVYVIGLASSYYKMAIVTYPRQWDISIDSSRAIPMTTKFRYCWVVWRS